MTLLSRRRFLTISAATTMMPAMSIADTANARWSGIALGAGASMQLAGLSGSEAAPIFAAIERELDRLENIFSLYRPESQISRLNRTGLLRDPAPELLEVLSMCSALHAGSAGAFDPTVQPLWKALAGGEDAARVEAARAKVGWQNLAFDQDRIAFLPGAPDGMALTLNGIAQGAITDRIVEMLHMHGLRDVLVDMGEIATRGHRAGGGDWQVGIAKPGGQVVRRVTLRNRAIATSSTVGFRLDSDSGPGHIIHPGGKNLAHASLVSVAADSAVVADGLSTALCLVSEERALDLLDRFSGANPERLI